MGKMIPAKERVWVSAESKSKYESLAGKAKRKKKSNYFKNAIKYPKTAPIFNYIAKVIVH